MITIKSFNILTISLSVLHNYFDDTNLAKDTSAKLFSHNYFDDTNYFQICI